MAVNREADVLCPAASIPAPRPQPIRDRQSTAASLSAASPGPGALAPRHGPLRANPAGAGPGRGGLRAARPPGAVARRRPLVAGLRNTRGSRCLALMWRFTRAEGITIRDLIGAIRLRRDILAGLGYYTTSWGECSRCGSSSTA